MCGSGGGEETCALRGVRMLGLQRTRRVSSALFVAHPTSFGSSLLAPMHREWDLTKPDAPEACLFCSELNPQWAPGRGNATDVQTSRHLSTSSISSQQSIWCSFSGCHDFLSALPIVADKRPAFSGLDMLPGLPPSLPASRRARGKGSRPSSKPCAMLTRCSPLGSRDTEGLSAYERERNKNVQQNRQVPSP